MRTLRLAIPPARFGGSFARLAFLLLLVAPESFAATTTRIAGTVRDAESGAPIAHALVSLPALHRSVTSSEDGHYEIEAPPGAQRVTVSRMGYAPTEFEALVPDAGELEIHIAMRCEPIRFPAIQVRATLPLRGMAPATGQADRTVTRDELNHDPLLVEPDFLRAMSGGDVVINPENPSGLHVRGGASDQVSYVVDGIPVFNPYHSSGTFSAWNPDALSQVDLLASAATPAAPDALSGTVSAHTRTPGAQHHTRGSVSATQARATFDGPLGRTATGYLFSITSAFPGLAFHNAEASHLDGDNFDLIAKTESPLFGGKLQLTGFGSRNHIDVASTGETGDTLAGDPARNMFGWNSASAGAEWSRPLGVRALTLRAWLARGDVDATWSGADSVARIGSERRESGAVATMRTPMAGGFTSFGVRFQQMTSAYRYTPENRDAYALDVATPVSTVFLEHARDLHATVTLAVSLAETFALGDDYLSPTAQLRWQAAPSLSFTGTAARRHQFGQSMRNAESVVSNVFPADIYLGAGEGGVPVAKSNIGILALESRPAAWLRLGAQGYVRDFAGLALVAPTSADPFATAGFAEGSGRANGVALEMGAARGQLGFLAGYGYQDVRLQHDGGGYVPGYGAVHSLEAGVTFSPAAGYSIRLGYESVMGRRTTPALGELEYEAVNLIDQGGEFGGSPTSGEPGGATLPAYHRLDLGVRKTWHTRFGNRDGVLAAFGTVSNIMSRDNVLTFAVDPASGTRTPVGMRPFSPLVVGIDWQF
jgi:hypothetical protein